MRYRVSWKKWYHASGEIDVEAETSDEAQELVERQIEELKGAIELDRNLRQVWVVGEMRDD